MNSANKTPPVLGSAILDVEETRIERLLHFIQYIHTLIKEENDLRLPKFSHQQFNYEENTESSSVPLNGSTEQDVLQRATSAFDGMIRWHHPFAVHNITPPPLLSTVAISCIANLYSPNCLWDYVSGKAVLFEKQVLKYLAELHNWNSKTSDGVFTSGGKATLMYAVKIGLNKCCRSTVKDGVNGQDFIVITSQASHYTLEFVCNLLGIGTKACIRIPADTTELMNIAHFEEELRKQLIRGKKIACIVVAGGNSLHNSIDPIYEVCQVRDKLVSEFGLDYSPHVHVDAVIGWAWLFFRYYNFKENKYEFPVDILNKLQVTYQKIADVSWADSSGVDFHKTGLCPYVSSAFIVRDKRDLHSINKEELAEMPYGEYGSNFIQHHTIEHSRSANGILSAWVAINQLGAEGFQQYLGHMMTVAESIRSKIDQQNFEVLNSFSMGFATVLLPMHPHYKLSFAELCNAPKEVIREYTLYCYGFFQFLSAQVSGEELVKPIIGFLSNYKLREDLACIPALRIYPMSPHLDNSGVEQLLDNLSVLKSIYEQMDTDNLNQSQISRHYPK